MGLALVPPGSNATQALADAQTALREAKSRGRNQLVLAQTDAAPDESTQQAA